MSLVLFLIFLLTVGISIRSWVSYSSNIPRHILLPHVLGQHRRFKYDYLAILLGVSLGLFITPIAVLANAPPATIQLDFQSWSDPLDAIQLIQCNSIDCTQPRVIAQYRTCDIAGCVPSPQIAPGSERKNQKRSPASIHCYETACLIAEPSFHRESIIARKLQLRVQSGDELLTSSVIITPQQIKQAWKISSYGADLKIKFANSWELPAPPEWFWGKGLFLTLGTEAVVLATTLILMNKKGQDWHRIFFSFGLMHLVTYPLLWTLPLGLIPFQTKIDRLIGFGVLFIAIIDVIILFFLRTTASWKLGLGTFLYLSLAYCSIAIIAFALNYSQSFPVTTGIPFTFALGITESVVILIETLILSFLSYGMLSLFSAGFLSAMMNLISLLVGVIFGYAWP